MTHAMRVLKLTVLILSILAGLLGLADAQRSADADRPAMPLPGVYAFITGAATGLRIVDVTNPDQPTEVGFLNTSSRVEAVSVVGEHAFLAELANGLRVADVSDLSSPVELPASPPPSTGAYAKDVVIVDHFAYVAHGFNNGHTVGLEIYNIEFPAQPVLVGAYNNGYGYERVRVAGHYAYLRGGHYELTIVDVADPHNPRLVGAFDHPLPDYGNWFGEAGLAISGQYAYLPAGSVFVLDVTTPSSPRSVREIGSWPYDVRVVGQRLYVLYTNTDTRVYDLSAPDNPRSIATFSSSGSGIDALDNYAYIAGGHLQIMDLTDPGHPQARGSSSHPQFSDQHIFIQDRRGSSPVTYTIAGTVTDEGGGALAGATVHLLGPRMDVSATSSSGAYSFSGLAPNQYGIWAEKPGYAASDTLSVTVPPSTTSANIILSPGYTISGHATDASGAPMSGVVYDCTQVAATGSRETGSAGPLGGGGGGGCSVTDANGNYTTPYLRTGQWVITPSKDGFIFSPPSRTVHLPPAQSGQDFVGRAVTLTPTPTPTSTSTAPPSGSRISGHIRDLSGTPIPDATVSANSGVTLMITSSATDGSYSFSNVPAGTYQVDVMKAGYTSLNSGVARVPPDRDNLDLEMQQTSSGADLGFRPSPNGFGFKNRSLRLEDGDWPMFQTFFGADKVLKPDGQHRCEAAERYFHEHYASWANGWSCVGFSLTSLLSYLNWPQPRAGSSYEIGHYERLYDQSDPAQFYPSIEYYTRIATAKEWGSGWGDEIQQCKENTARPVQRIKEGLQNRQPLILSLFPFDGKPGHTVAPYRVEDVSVDEADVYVYDSEAPGQEHKVHFKRENTDWQWTYTFVGSLADYRTPQNVGCNKLYLYPVATSLQTPTPPQAWCTTPASYLASSAASGAIGRILADVPPTGDWWLSDTEGRRLGWVNASLVSEIPNAFVIPQAFGVADAAPRSLSLPADNYTLQNGSGVSSPQHVSLFADGRTLILDSSLKSSYPTSAIRLNTSLDAATLVGADNLDSLSLSYSSELLTESRVGELTSTSISGTQDLETSFDGQELHLSHATGAITYQVALRNQGGRFLSQAVTLGPNEAHSIRPSDWANLDAPVLLQIDNGRTGHIDETRVLQRNGYRVYLPLLANGPAGDNLPSPTSTPTPTPIRTLSLTSTPTHIPLPTSTQTRTPPPTPTRTSLPTPTASPTAVGSITGQLVADGSSAAGQPLVLRRYNAVSEVTVMTTTTRSTGFYQFTNPPVLTNGDKYYVRFGPNNTEPAYVSVWYGPDIVNYDAGQTVSGGTLNIADAPLLSPQDGDLLSFPITFTWQRRATSTDSYRVRLFDPATQTIKWVSGPLGYVGSLTLASANAAPGVELGKAYYWWLEIDDSATTGNSYGLSYNGRSITFTHPATSTASVTPTSAAMPTSTPTPTAPPPSNDNCSNAMTIPSWGPWPQVYRQDTRGATAPGSDPTACGSSGDSHSVWYRWTAASSGVLDVATCGSNYDTVLTVWEGAACDIFGSPAACSDDACSTQSQVSIVAHAGQSYLIKVASYGVQNGGDLRLDVSFEAATPTPLPTPSPTPTTTPTPNTITAEGILTDARIPWSEMCEFDFTLKTCDGQDITFPYRTLMDAGALQQYDGRFVRVRGYVETQPCPLPGGTIPVFVATGIEELTDRCQSQFTLAVDDQSNNFEKFGAAQYWRDSGVNDVTYQGHAYWTGTKPSSPTENYATWTPHLWLDGWYEIRAYVPLLFNGRDDTHNARYEILTDFDTWQTVSFDQAAYNLSHGRTVSDRWVSLGTYWLEGNHQSVGQVRLGDYTGESGRGIGVDAVQWVYRGRDASPR